LKGLSLAVRPLPNNILSLNELGLPEVFYNLTCLKHGLILITGPAGCGKTTTLASFLSTINQHEERHIITIEDPIEYLIANKRSLIHQREVGWHTASFSDGLRSALRENPDVIVIGELRDLDSISLALRAAETGHLVLGTLHSGTAIQALTRIVDIFDSVRQPQIMVQLAQSLQCVCSQNLIKRKGKPGMVLATEILIGTLAIRNLIRQNRLHEIRGYIETGQAENMHTLKQSIAQLIQSGMIDEEQNPEVTEYE
jgi:twitching motility protein PilT